MQQVSIEDIKKNFNSMSSNKIVGIIGEEEFKKVIPSIDVVVISIQDPHTKSEEKLNYDGWKDYLNIKFWDLEEDFCKMKIISSEIAKEIAKFIIKNKNERFIIHCKAGQSRSAGVGIAVEIITLFNGNSYEYYTCYSSEISSKPRYTPLYIATDKIIEEYNKLSS